jgi:hypothetical protein
MKKLLSIIGVAAIAVVASASVAPAGATAPRARSALMISQLPSIVVRIAWTYAAIPPFGDEAQRRPNLAVSWPSCFARGGRRVLLPSNGRIYGGNSNNPAVLFRRSNGRFSGAAYVGASRSVGSSLLFVGCRSATGQSLGVGQIKVSFIRRLFDFSQLATLSAGITIPAEANASNCRDPHVHTLTISSQALAPGADGTRRRIFTRKDRKTFVGHETGATDLPTGNYPATVRCGSGVIANATIRLLAQG